MASKVAYFGLGHRGSKPSGAPKSPASRRLRTGVCIGLELLLHHLHHPGRRKIVEKSKIPRVANPPEWHSPPPYLTFDLTFRCTPPTATPGTGPGGASPRTVPRRRPSRSVKITLSCVTTKSRVDPRDSEHHNTQDAMSANVRRSAALGVVRGSQKREKFKRAAV